MKRTGEKFAEPVREKTTRPNPNPGSPQKPERVSAKNTQKPTAFGNRKKVEPNEWQAATPTESADQQRKEEPDLEDQDPEESVV